MSELTRKDLVDSLGRSTHRMVRPQVQPSVATINAAKEMKVVMSAPSEEKSFQGVYASFSRLPGGARETGARYAVRLEHDQIGNAVELEMHKEDGSEPRTSEVLRSLAEDVRAYHETGSRGGTDVDSLGQILIRYGLTDDAEDEAKQIRTQLRASHADFAELTGAKFGAADPYQALRGAIKTEDGDAFDATSWPKEFGFDDDETLSLEDLRGADEAYDRNGDLWVHLGEDTEYPDTWVAQDTRADTIPASNEDALRIYGPFTWGG